MTDQLDRLKAALADRYTLERELGAGGMATVYLAADLKHERKVAIKVLRPELAAVLGAERFVQEIKTTANLQHPNILPLFDSGEADGFLYYVMPYVEGETLRAKLNRETQLGVDEAVKLTTEVADALEYAHQQGVIHRDIKPENILLHAGRPLVADFGIALAVSAAAGGRMTETGLSLGTPHYMSPEQATAEKQITARSDIYSLGAVLYEMLTGDPPHTGSSAQAIILKIVSEEVVPVTKRRRAVPANVAAAVAQALEKLPADRFADASSLAAALADRSFAGEHASFRGVIRRQRVGSRRSLYGMLTLGAVLTAVAAAGWLRPGPLHYTSRQRVVLWRHSLMPLLDPSGEKLGSQAAIAPDGSSIVFVDSTGGALHLMRKRRSEAAGEPVGGTDGALSPFFSPDSKWIGYVTIDGKLKKVPIDGGGPVILAEDASQFIAAAAWLDDGTITYVGLGGLRRINANGGLSRRFGPEVTPLQRTIATLSPLPGSSGLLLTTCPGNCGIESQVQLFDFSADSARMLVPNAAGAWHSPTGHLIYTDRAGGVYAIDFDLVRLTVTGGAVPVIEDVVPGSFTLSASGSALYSIAAGRGAEAELMWVSRDGSAVPLDSTWRGDFQYPALSPDGKQLAVATREETTQLWVRQSGGARQKLTQEGMVNWRPAWTPDGRSVVFVSNRRGGGSRNDFDVFGVPVDGSTPAALWLRHSFGVWEAEVSPDGRWLVVRSDEERGSNIRARRLDGDTAPVPLVVDRTVKMQIALSPDGRWLAYTGDLSGRPQLYVVPFPNVTSSRLVSPDATEPRWAHSGRELFFKSGNRLMTLPVTVGETFTFGTPRPLFSVAAYRAARTRPQYDVAPDDQHFVMIRNVSGTAGDVVYVEDWFPELLARAKR
jgi:serine/threonine-protein kinase